MPNIITRGAMSAKAVGFTGQTAAPVYVEDVFSTYLYNSTGASQTISNGIDLATKGGLVWVKRRNTTSNHLLWDSSRGTYSLITNDTSSEANSYSSAPTFLTNGFTDNLGAVGDWASWTFRKAAKFFTICTWTGSGVARTISHDLGCVPGMIIVKRTDTTGNWQVYHKSLTSAAYSIQFNLTNAQASATTVWNSTAPTSSVFSVGTDATVNASGGTYVAYLFADSSSGGFGLSGTDSVVACGSFTTDASLGEATVNLGWEPQFLILKNSQTAGYDWVMADNMRGIATAATSNMASLLANTSGAETTASYVQLTSTGFKINGGFGGSQNGIYLAIRRGPMKTPTDATKVFAIDTLNSTAPNPPAWKSNFPVDVGMFVDRTSPGVTICSRLQGNQDLYTYNTNAEGAATRGFDYNNGWLSAGTSPVSTYLSWMFRRAPGFFDVVCYTGTGSLTGVSHNLGVTPELKIIKRRSAAADWVVGGSLLGASQYIYVNTTAAAVSSSNYWDGGTDSPTMFSVRNTNANSDASGSTYVAYLFATCPGVSKVGSYTGTGAAQNINCGFSSSARFILIKRTDSTGNWYIYDSARGISASNDPYLLLNSTAAEVTNTNYVDAFASGFTLTSTAPAGLNANGGSYIFLAIA